MNAGIIDISVTLEKGMLVWPGSIEYTRQQDRSLSNGDLCNRSQMHIDMHMGTHVDAPLHFLRDGTSVDQLDLALFCGPAYVADLTHVGAIGECELAGLGLPEGTVRVLFKTANSYRLWSKEGFDAGFVGLTGDGAEWLIKHGIRMVGNDYLSVQRYGDGPGVHHLLLGAGIGVLEGITLGHVEPGEYELVCLPLKIKNAEGAPARAVLRWPIR